MFRWRQRSEEGDKVVVVWSEALLVGMEGAFGDGRVIIEEELALICVSLKRVECLHSCREEEPFWRRREREGGAVVR